MLVCRDIRELVDEHHLLSPVSSNQKTRRNDAEEWYRELCAEYGVLTERQVAALTPRTIENPATKVCLAWGLMDASNVFQTMVNPQG